MWGCGRRRWGFESKNENERGCAAQNENGRGCAALNESGRGWASQNENGRGCAALNGWRWAHRRTTEESMFFEHE